MILNGNNSNFAVIEAIEAIKEAFSLEAIFTRRSIRRFTNEPVTQEQITGLLQAAMTAPSAGNQQPWEFIVVRERAPLVEITTFHQYSQMLKEAPAAIIVCADIKRSKYAVDYWIQDCAAATQNILLAAVSAGLGTCWLGIHPQQERVEGVRRIFGIPESIVPFAVVAVGYPAKMPRRPSQFDENRIHQEKW